MTDEPRDATAKRQSLASELTGLVTATSERSKTIGSQVNSLEEHLRGTQTPYDTAEEKQKEPAGLLPTLITASRDAANALTRASKILADLITEVQAE